MGPVGFTSLRMNFNGYPAEQRQLHPFTKSCPVEFAGHATAVQLLL